MNSLLHFWRFEDLVWLCVDTNEGFDRCVGHSWCIWAYKHNSASPSAHTSYPLLGCTTSNLTQLLSFSPSPAEFHLPVGCAPSLIPRSGCWEVKRERAGRVAFSEKCGIMGASWRGDGEHNCARCVDRAAGERKGWEAPEKKGRGGDTSITCALPDPALSLSVSPWTDPLSEGRCWYSKTTSDFVQDTILFLLFVIINCICILFIICIKSFQSPVNYV